MRLPRRPSGNRPVSRRSGASRTRRSAWPRSRQEQRIAWEEYERQRQRYEADLAAWEAAEAQRLADEESRRAVAAEAERVAAEQAEAQRLAAEAEAERLAALAMTAQAGDAPTDQAQGHPDVAAEAAQRAEAERLAAQAEAERLAAEPPSGPRRAPRGGGRPAGRGGASRRRR
ncbi:MAG: hypothetical protein R3C32_12175 [Chloroflexota bacterium]